VRILEGMHLLKRKQTIRRVQRNSSACCRNLNVFTILFF